MNLNYKICNNNNNNSNKFNFKMKWALEKWKKNILINNFYIWEINKYNKTNKYNKKNNYNKKNIYYLVNIVICIYLKIEILYVIIVIKL